MSQMAGHKELDAVTGVETTGHVWDGDLKELNKPLPRWWLYVLYATIVWSIGYWILYPAFPLVDSYTKGVLGYSQRTEVANDIAAAKASQARFVEAIAAKPAAEIEKDPELMEFVLRGGAAQFANNCAPCHGRGAQGFTGYPNLNDDDWLWGGTLAAIYHTLKVGVRSTSPDTQSNIMSAYLRDGILTSAQVNDVADYVLSLSGHAVDARAAERGAEIFAERVRKQIARAKVTAEGWLEVHQTAHELGLPTNATMLYGHVETLEERVDHMLRLRQQQDDTGGFLSFIPLAFQPDNNQLAKELGTRHTTGVDDLRNLAVARLVLDNFPHIKGYWIMITPELTQVSLSAGISDIDGTIKDEKIAHASGAVTEAGMTEEELVRLVKDAGRVPVRRDALYNELKVYA